jgi:hypothetical protein
MNYIEDLPTTQCYINDVTSHETSIEPASLCKAEDRSVVTTQKNVRKVEDFILEES